MKRKDTDTISESLLHPKTKVESGVLEKGMQGIIIKFFQNQALMKSKTVLILYKIFL